MADDAPWLKAHLRGTNPRLASAASMIKTTTSSTGRASMWWST
jgi:hypothetical protein